MSTTYEAAYRSVGRMPSEHLKYDGIAPFLSNNHHGESVSLCRPNDTLLKHILDRLEF